MFAISSNLIQTFKRLSRSLAIALLVGLIGLLSLPAAPVGAVPSPERAEDLVNPASKDTFHERYADQEDGVRAPVKGVDLGGAAKRTLQGAREGSERIQERASRSLNDRTEMREKMNQVTKGETQEWGPRGVTTKILDNIGDTVKGVTEGAGKAIND
ncbi:hypothetical protein [Leptolyngbya sp. FACHB-261]|uniref:hypothetical protein n=1 Tax=Leptolyngbya sp. FACHB-261 TaxID=2692806 RepID=UPI00168519E1|nr:hypothetical protein [Leptolyngbya sp. FACHB-261]MBD2103672.1 hypothetical protein [Leptolyngbya sp. FACHB-261]